MLGDDWIYISKALNIFIKNYKHVCHKFQYNDSFRINVCMIVLCLHMKAYQNLTLEF